MRDACIRAVSGALGRELRPEEIRDIEERISRHMRMGARGNPTEWAAKPESERLTEAGVAAARELAQEAKRKKDNLETRAVRMQALNNFIDEQIADGRDSSRLDAFSRILAPRADAGGAPEGGAVDQRAQGVYGDAVASLMEMFEAGKRRGIWRFIPLNEPGTNALLRRALAGETKNVPPEFVRMAKAAHDYIDLMRRRYNAAGGAIGRLEDWGEPHRWSDVLVLREINRRVKQMEGAHTNPLNWAAAKRQVAHEFAEAANRSAYVAADGRVMTIDEIAQFMDQALTTIVSDGANKRLAGERPEFATSVAANRHRAHREIHLRADAVSGMLDKFSEMGAMESLLIHMRSLARDVALVETFGPNAELTARQMLQESYDRDVEFTQTRSQKAGLVLKRRLNEYLYDYLAGNGLGQRHTLGRITGFLRSIATFKSLGFTVWSSLTDPVIMQHVAAARGLDAGRLWINDVRFFAGGGRRWAKRAGLITDTVAGYADRVNADLFSVEMGARAASFTLKATGLNWVTEARRAAYGTTMMDAIGHLVRHNQSLSALKDADDAALLRLLNVSEDTWSIWRLAKLESMGSNHTLLSPQSIYAIDDAAILAARPGADPELVKHNAATQLLGIVKDEINTAVTTAGSRERSTLTLGTEAGTVAGELTRSITLFKSFPWTFLNRQGDLVASMKGGRQFLPDAVPGSRWLTTDRARYMGSMIVSTWMMGILINWIYDLLSGKDPRAIDPNSAEGKANIIAGLLRGGGLGLYGDFLFANSDPANRSQSMASTLTGPVLSQIDDVQQLTLGNLNQAATGQETDAGPEAINFLQRQVTPNFWYTKAPLDRWIFNALQEEVQPGYWARRQNREFSTRGTTYFWNPAEPDDIRAPDLSRATEGDMPERAN